MFSQIYVMHKPFPPTFSPISRHTNPILSRFLIFSSRLTISASSDSNSEPTKPKPKTRRSKTVIPRTDENIAEISSITTPKKPRRRGRKSEAAAVEDFVRDSLEQTFASIRKQNLENFEDKDSVMKTRAEKSVDSSKKDVNTEINDDDDEEEEEDVVVVEEDSESWPIDAEVGYGIRASEYFDQHSIKNVIGEDGVEIDWEGEIDDGWLNEINCLEWESFAFHPSPLIVLVFERYNRASDNWKVLKELEKAAKVYWSAKDRLPPRMVKIDINIERDLAYALKVKEGPQVLFIRGNKMLYREKEVRTSDELVQMIAHFYYKAKKPSWIDDAALSPPYIR